MECFSDIPLSVLSKSSHIAERFCSSGSATEFYHGFQSGMTLQHSTESLGAVSQISYAEASHVKMCQERTNLRLAQMVNEVGCGKSLSESLKKHKPRSRSSKTALCSTGADLTTFCGKLPQSGTMLLGIFFPQQNAEHHIGANGSGVYVGTPTMCDALGNKGRSKRFQTGVPSPTELAGGKVSALWIEWIMGWPETWTGLNVLPMGKYQQWQQRHGTSCAKESGRKKDE